MQGRGAGLRCRVAVQSGDRRTVRAAQRGFEAEGRKDDDPMRDWFRQSAGSRSGEQRSDPGWRARAGAGVLLAAVLALAGCTEQTQNCFPYGSSCTDAAAYSEFFEPSAPCCQGSCVDAPPDPQNQNAIAKECQ